MPHRLQLQRIVGGVGAPPPFEVTLWWVRGASLSIGSRPRLGLQHGPLGGRCRLCNVKCPLLGPSLAASAGPLGQQHHDGNAQRGADCNHGDRQRCELLLLRGRSTRTQFEATLRRGNLVGRAVLRQEWPVDDCVALDGERLEAGVRARRRRKADPAVPLVECDVEVVQRGLPNGERRVGVAAALLHHEGPRPQPDAFACLRQAIVPAHRVALVQILLRRHLDKEFVVGRIFGHQPDRDGRQPGHGVERLVVLRQVDTEHAVDGGPCAGALDFGQVGRPRALGTPRHKVPVFELERLAPRVQEIACGVDRVPGGRRQLRRQHVDDGVKDVGGERKHGGPRVDDGLGRGIVRPAVQVEPGAAHQHRRDRHRVVRLVRGGRPHHRGTVKRAFVDVSRRTAVAVFPHDEGCVARPVACRVDCDALPGRIDVKAVGGPRPRERRGGEAKLRGEDVLRHLVLHQLGEVRRDPPTGDRRVRHPHDAREGGVEEVGLLRDGSKAHHGPQIADGRQRVAAEPNDAPVRGARPRPLDVRDGNPPGFGAVRIGLVEADRRRKVVPLTLLRRGDTAPPAALGCCHREIRRSRVEQTGREVVAAARPPLPRRRVQTEAHVEIVVVLVGQCAVQRDGDHGAGRHPHRTPQHTGDRKGSPRLHGSSLAATPHTHTHALERQRMWS
mmetsp:Transcript_1842/g.4644  ORF Transcript_1842/g.4644 Transcript_1842/m.4644 type:complete len:671 (-) Transcript_1842:125-2137(-)